MIGVPRQPLSREQKVGFIFVIVCGIGAVVLGGLYMWHHLAVPFVITYNGPEVQLQGQTDSAQIVKDKKTDTDGDGLSDYDEKNIYHTSPYLADSDSDGISDYTEVTTGTDPNCATGKTCASADSTTAPQDTSALTGLTPPTPPTPPAGLDPSVAASLGADTSGTAATTQTSLGSTSFSAADIAALRQGGTI